ncbi:hypothetical protein E2C01_040939 [Portunus trituberculatus]|uniref:Ig-like domain-containing protein n=1 Tax=Portunus trituberculatus TaxID=210409 RepID=A0A5B7FL35_PORTR|nr:hypothetical protein [Portunus trituberculatus]
MQKYSVTYGSGEDVGFTCEVTHPLPYFVTWLKDNKPLDDKLADRIQQQDSGQQHILKAILLIVVRILGPISPPKLIFNGIATKRYVVGFEPTRGRLADPMLTTLSTMPPP